MKSPACAVGARNARHACTGCSCSCHDVGPPKDFRALVHAARERAHEEEGDAREHR